MPPTLLVAEVVISLVISWCVVRILRQPTEQILHRITSDETSRAWLKYVKFAIYVAGVSGGVKIAEKDFEKFMRMAEVNYSGSYALGYGYMVWLLTAEIWEAVVGALGGIFWFLAYFFIAAAIAFVIVRVLELIKSKPADTQDRA
jgi:hypothetical protein